MLHRFISAFNRLPFFLRVFLIAAALIAFFGVLIYIVEPETFQSPFQGIWWAVITASTVGYGDIVPVTVAGKLTGMLYILFGAGFISTYIIFLSKTAFDRHQSFLEGKMMFRGKDHTIVIGWNERAKEMILKLSKNHAGRPVVLIDETLPTNPLKEQHIHFIRGRSHADEVLKRANLKQAKNVVITADQNKDELQADMQTILTILAVKGLNPDVHCIAEILTAEQTENAKRAGADQIIQSNAITSSVMLHCLAGDSKVDSLVDLLEQIHGNKLYFRSSQSFAGMEFSEASQSLLKENCLLLGVKRGDFTRINPPHPFVIRDGDILLVLGHNGDGPFSFGGV